MRCDPEVQEQFKRMQNARRRVVLIAESLVAAGAGNDELREALRVHMDEMREFERLVTT